MVALNSYSVSAGRAWNYWHRGRVGQIARTIVCAFRGHDWSPWTTDDYEGPGECMVAGDIETFMPYLSREAREGEHASRICRRCPLVETRSPVG